MEKLAGTYGKTWHTWHTPAWTPNATSARGTEVTDRQLNLPTGTPMLMMGFVDGHPADPRLVAERDKRLDVSSERNATSAVTSNFRRLSLAPMLGNRASSHSSR